MCVHSRKFLGQRDMHDVVRESMKMFPLPAGVVDHSLGSSLLDKLVRVRPCPLSPYHAANYQLTTMPVCLQVLGQQFRILSYNRARQRRKVRKIRLICLPIVWLTQ